VPAFEIRSGNLPAKLSLGDSEVLRVDPAIRHQIEPEIPIRDRLTTLRLIN
jgi:hypothetical protein